MHRSVSGLRQALAVATCFLAGGSALRAQESGNTRGARHLTLENGLEVIVIENHSVPIATVMIAFRGGAMTQSAEDQGIPHLFEHMLFKGYRGPRDETFNGEAAALQAGSNGETSDETVSYYLTMPSVNALESVRLIADLVRSPRFEDDDLRTERFVVLGELQRNQSVPLFQLRRETQNLLWGSSFMRKNTIGETSAILVVKPRYLETIFRRYYVPNNAALIVTGDVVTADVFAAARSRFGGWQRQPDPFKEFPVPPMQRLASTQGVVVAADVKDVTIMVEWQGPSARRQADATYAADVLADLVSDPDSPFQKRLVESGAFQSASLNYQTLDHVGPITFFGVTRWDRIEGALTALSGEFETMRDTAYVEATAIQSAKKRRAVATALQQEEGAVLADALASYWSVGGLEYYLGYLDRMSSRSSADIQRFLSTYVNGKPYVVGLLVRPEYATRAQALLKEFNSLMEAP